MSAVLRTCPIGPNVHRQAVGLHRRDPTGILPPRARTLEPRQSVAVETAARETSGWISSTQPEEASAASKPVVEPAREVDDLWHESARAAPETSSSDSQIATRLPIQTLRRY